jgi:hypothetical protein
MLEIHLHPDSERMDTYGERGLTRKGKEEAKDWTRGDDMNLTVREISLDCYLTSYVNTIAS